MMEAELTDKQWWYEVDGPQGTEWIPADLVDDHAIRAELANWEKGTIPAGLVDYCENTSAWTIRREYGYGVRSSMPGYLDCTAWTVYANLQEAKRAYRQEARECRGDE